MEKLLKLLDPADVRGGLWRLIALSLVCMTILRAVINPNPVIFPVGDAGVADYWTMVTSKSFLISIDAMLLVLLSWKYLRDWKDVVGISTFVGLTHVVFPLFTFALTAGTAVLAQTTGLPMVLAVGMESTIYFVACVFVGAHLRTIHVESREGDAKVVKPLAPVFSWQGVIQVFPAVFAVSIDALQVGPSAIGFMERYETTAFAMSFLYIGGLVFLQVFASGILVLILKASSDHRNISGRVHGIDYRGVLALIAVFMFFTVFAGVYVLYTFADREWLLEITTILGATAVCFSFYLVFGRIGEIKAASRLRAGVSE